MNNIIKLEGEHWTVTSITLNAFTDAIDSLVHRNEYFLFEGEIEEEISGNIFFLENEHNLNAFVILVDNPDYEKARLRIASYTATVEATSKVTVIPCKKGECEAICRRTVRNTMRSNSLVTMSNTWGEGNGFSKVNE